MKKYILKTILSMVGILSILSTSAYALEKNDNLKDTNIEVTLSADNNIEDKDLCKYDLNKSSFPNKDIEESKEGINLLQSEEEIHYESVESYNSSSDDEVTDTNTDEDTDVDNTSPNGAAYIDVNAIYGDTINAEQEQRWFLTHLDSRCKLTLYLQTLDNADINYDLHLFAYDEETGSIDEVDSSNYGSQVDEQLSAILDSGYYFICVNSVNGFDAENQFQIAAITSDKYDDAEPDDNFFSSSVKSGTNLSINQTIDNYFDTDWMQITVNTKSYVKSTLSNVDSANKYEYLLYDSNSELLTSTPFESGYNYGYTLEPGTYYVRVFSVSGYDADKSYNLKINMQDYDEYLSNISYNYSASRVGRNVRVNISSDGEITQECHAIVTFTGGAGYRDFSLQNTTGRKSVSSSNPFSTIVTNPLASMYGYKYAFVVFYVNDHVIGTQYVY